MFKKWFHCNILENLRVNNPRHLSNLQVLVSDRYGHAISSNPFKWSQLHNWLVMKPALINVSYANGHWIQAKMTWHRLDGRMSWLWDILGSFYGRNFTQFE